MGSYGGLSLRGGIAALPCIRNWNWSRNCVPVAADCKDSEDDDAECNNVAATNSILLSLLNDRLKQIHDVELALCDHDASQIVQLLCSRNCNSADYVLPPCETTRFRCYVWTLASSHLVLTVVPATYSDMVTVMLMLDSLVSLVDLVDNDAPRSTDNKNLESVSETVDCNGISASQDSSVSKYVEESSGSRENMSHQAEVEALMQNVELMADEHVTMERPCDIRLPVFVFDCLMHSVSEQLIHQSSADRPTDIVEDFTYQVMVVVSGPDACPVWVLAAIQ